MTNTETMSYENWKDANVYDNSGDKIGTLSDMYRDVDTGRPEWLAISTGWFGSNVSFAPIAGATQHDDGLRINYTKDQVKDAPNAEADGELSEAEERRLYQHYGIAYEGGRDAYPDTDRFDRDYDVRDDDRTDTGHDADGVVRREEELNVATQEQQAGKVRLRKYVTTDTETVTVPVKKEKVRVEREPVSGETTTGPIGDDESVEEITLREERAVVNKETVAKERVSLDKETVTEQETVSADVRKEHVEVEGDAVDEKGR